MFRLHLQTFFLALFVIDKRRHLFFAFILLFQLCTCATSMMYMGDSVIGINEQ